MTQPGSFFPRAPPWGNPQLQAQHLAANLPAPIHTFGTWRVQALHDSEWLAQYVDDPPAWEALAARLLTRPRTLVDTILRHGHLVPAVFAYFSQLAWSVLTRVPSQRATQFVLHTQPLRSSDDHSAWFPAEGLGTTSQDGEVLLNALCCAVAPLCAAAASPELLVAYVRSMLRALEIAGRGVLLATNFETLQQALSDNRRGRTPREMLVLELLRQQGVLEVNAHPYYHPNAFSARRDYGLWRQAELARIKALVRRLWSGSEAPSSHHNDYTGSNEHHVLYKRLLRFCMYTDEVSKKAPAERLSSPAQALLEEYALQFGISPLFRQQAILDALAEHFSPSLHHIRHTLKALQDLAELLPESYASLIASNADQQALRSSLNCLHDHVKKALSNLHKVFPHNSPPHALDSMLNLLTMLLVVDQRLATFKQPESMLTTMLQRYFGKSLHETHQQLLQTHAQDRHETTCTQIIAVLQEVIREVCLYACYFQSAFRPYGLDLPQFAARLYYDLLCGDVKRLCASALAASKLAPEAFEIDENIIHLLVQLKALDERWHHLLPLCSSERWKTECTPLVLRWLDCWETKAMEWISHSVAQDGLKPLVLERKDRVYDMVHSMLVPISGSLIDSVFIVAQIMRLAQRLFELLFSNVSKSDLQAIEDTVAFWEDTLMCIQQRRRQCLDHLRRTVCACIHHYAVETMRPNCRDLPAAVRKELDEKFAEGFLASLGMEAEHHGQAPADDGLKPIQTSRSLFENVDMLPDSVLSAMTKIPEPWNTLFLLETAAVPRNESAGLSSTRRRTLSTALLTPPRAGLGPAVTSTPIHVPAPLRSTMRLEGGSLGQLREDEIEDFDLLSQPMSFPVGQLAVPSEHSYASLQHGLAELSSRRLSSCELVNESTSPNANVYRYFAAGMQRTSMESSPATSRASSVQGSPPKQQSSPRKRLPQTKPLQTSSSSLTKVHIEPITPAMSLCLNNMQTWLEALPDLAQTFKELAMGLAPGIEAGLDDWNTSERELPCATEYLQEVQNCQINLLCYRMNVFVKPSLRLLLHDLQLNRVTLVDRLRPVSRFLSRELHQVNEHMLPDVFQATLYQMWCTICQDFAEPVLADTGVISNIQPSFALRLFHALEFFTDYFFDDGVGITENELDIAERQLFILRLYTLPTLELCHLYSQACFEQCTELLADQARWHIDGTLCSPSPVHRKVSECLCELPQPISSLRLRGDGRSSTEDESIFSNPHFSQPMSPLLPQNVSKVKRATTAVLVAAADVTHSPKAILDGGGVDFVLPPLDSSSAPQIIFALVKGVLHLQDLGAIVPLQASEWKSLQLVRVRCVLSALVLAAEYLRGLLVTHNVIRSQGLFNMTKNSFKGKMFLDFLVEYGGEEAVAKDTALGYGGGERRKVIFRRRPDQSLGFVVHRNQVRTVTLGGIADQCGLQEGDLLVAINGEGTSCMSHEDIVERLKMACRPMATESCSSRTATPAGPDDSSDHLVLVLLVDRRRHNPLLDEGHSAIIPDRHAARKLAEKLLLLNIIHTYPPPPLNHRPEPFADTDQLYRMTVDDSPEGPPDWPGPHLPVERIVDPAATQNLVRDVAW